MHPDGCFLCLIMHAGSDCWQGDSNGLTALHHAAKKGHVDVMGELLLNAPEPSLLASPLVARNTK